MPSKINFRLIAGSILLTITIVLLTILGWFFWWKYTGPTPLAKILPANETLLLFELHPRTEAKDWNMLRANWQGMKPNTLLELDALGIQDSENFWRLADRRIGIAFLGEKLDPRRFILCMDSTEPRAVLDYLSKQGFFSEKLKAEKYLGAEIFTYPNSHNFAFTFRGNDLILASSLADLKKVIATYRGEAITVSETADYRAVLRKLNPRGLGFGYFSQQFINQLVIARLDGIENALATPLLNLWQSGGCDLEATLNGVKLTTHFILRDDHVRDPLFAESDPLDTDSLQLLDSAITKFWLVEKGAQQITHLLSATESLNPNFSIVARGTGLNLLQKWLGSNVNFSDLTPLFIETSLLGVTKDSGFIGIFSATDTEELQRKILAGKGLLSAAEKTISLPDRTSGHILTPTIDPTTSTEITNGQIVKKIKFPQYELSFTTVGRFTIITSDSALLKKILAQSREANTGFATLITESGFKKGNLHYTRLTDSTIALLQPFHFALFNLTTTADEVILGVFLGK